MGSRTRGDVIDKFIRLPQSIDLYDENFDLKEWILVYSCIKVGKNKDLLADAYGKVENETLYLVGEINTSQYSSGGDYLGVIFQLDLIEFENYKTEYDELELEELGPPKPSEVKNFAIENSLEKFLLDFNLNCKFQSGVVCQTL